LGNPLTSLDTPAFSRSRRMPHRVVALIVSLGLFLGAVPLLRSGDPSSKFAGTWKTKGKGAGFDLTLTVAKEAGQWSVKGTVEKNGGVVGTYLGEGVALESGRLAFQRKFTKKPARDWDDQDAVTLGWEGDTLVATAVTKGGQKTVRYFARV